MNNQDHGVRNWFHQGGSAYARFRPEYPPALVQFLASKSPGRAFAADIGCGSGQLTVQLAEHFGQVAGIDSSIMQITHANTHPRVKYACAPAEQLPLASHSTQLVTAAQAVHWFDLPRFYEEVRRIAAPQALLALISYGVLQLNDELNPLFTNFYQHKIGPYWPAERRQVDSGYTGLFFPFSEEQPAEFSIHKKWNLHELLGYISTWSAVRHASMAGQHDILQNFASKLAKLWGDPTSSHDMRWPVRIRLGRVPNPDKSQRPPIDFSGSWPAQQ